MNAFWKDIFREINNTKGRFLSLLIITILGAASVVGIQSAAIDMRDVADRLYKESNLYDLQIKSTVGFSDVDISALSETEGAANVMPTKIFDAYITFDDDTRAVRTYALPDTLNTINITRGRLPENANECVIERRLMYSGSYELGDNIVLELDDKESFSDVFAADTFTIVGVVSSPLYISGHERGNTTLGDGSLGFYLYLHPDAYAIDVYTDVYIQMNGTLDMDNLTDDYYTAADEWKDTVKQTGDIRVREFLDELAEAQVEINDEWQMYYDGLRELEDKVAEGRQELADAKTELDDAVVKLNDGQDTLDKEIADGLAEIAANERTLRNGQTELNAARSELLAALEQLEAIAPQGVSPELDIQYAQVYGGMELINARQSELDSGVRRLNAARATLEEERVKAQAEIDEGWAEYYEGLEKYNDGIVTLEREEADALAELADAESELTDAQEKLDDAPEPEWYYFTRKDGVAFDSYYQDTLRLQKVGYVFPMVFFLVAILVSLTSMSRMVEEHRTQIGVYSALGYRPSAIMMKYFIYSFGASFIGGILGVLLGSNLFPIVIADAYNHLYSMPPVSTPVPLFIGLVAIIVSVVSVVSVTLTTCAGAIKGEPAMLMRPKAPVIGKFVFLEKLPFIWNRLGFIGKVTARNIFRYKKRFLMTLIGIAGCSALLLTAFGLRDSISGVSALQFGEIVKYDTRAFLKDIRTDAEYSEIVTIIDGEYLFVREESVDAKGDGGDGLPASVIVPEFYEKLTDYFNLRSSKTGASVPFRSDSVLVTDKLARVIGVSVGDEFSIVMGDGKTVTVFVTDIVENYVMHHIYMTGGVYAELFGIELYPNSVLCFTDDGSGLAEKLLDNSDVRGVMQITGFRDSLRDSTDALGIVTLVLIILACSLAFVVLFNLTNINISERIRELATIKVLGFYDSDLALYVYRENGAVTGMGIALGLLLGIVLHKFILVSVEIDLLKFPAIILPQSYIYAVALSALFAVFVNLVMNVKLKGIDMVESLKNVE